MTKNIALICFILLATLAHGQNASLKQTDSTLQSVQHQTDIAQKKYSTKLDSLQSVANTNRWKDSLKITGWSDSLRSKINFRYSDKVIAKQMDSLRSINLPDDKIRHTSDSMLKKKEALLAEVNTKQQELQGKITGRYTAWSQNLRSRFNLDSAGVKLSESNLSSVPKVTDPLASPLPEIPVANLPTSSIPEMPALNTGDFSGLSLSPDLTSIGGNTSIPSMDQLKGWDKSLPALPDPIKEIETKTGELKALTKDPGIAAEGAVANIGEVSSAVKELKAGEALTTNNELAKLQQQVGNPEQMKEMAKREAVNHFQGQEAAVQGAMTEMSKYKKKYSSLGSLSEIKKNDWLPRNGLKGKPFKERFRIGLHAGFKNAGDTLLLDFYPNASYRITGRFEAGLGAIYRVRINTRSVTLDQHNPVWGLSSFVNVKTWKSIMLRVELDGNSFPRPGSTDKPAYRDWRWSFHSGIQTNFKLGKQWTGLVQMLYNFDSNLKDGFPEKLTARVGVQYRLK